MVHYSQSFSIADNALHVGTLPALSSAMKQRLLTLEILEQAASTFDKEFTVPMLLQKLQALGNAIATRRAVRTALALACRELVCEKTGRLSTANSYRWIPPKERSLLVGRRSRLRLAATKLGGIVQGEGIVLDLSHAESLLRKIKPRRS